MKKIIFEATLFLAGAAVCAQGQMWPPEVGLVRPGIRLSTPTAPEGANVVASVVSGPSFFTADPLNYCVVGDDPHLLATASVIVPSGPGRSVEFSMDTRVRNTPPTSVMIEEGLGSLLPPSLGDRPGMRTDLGWAWVSVGGPKFVTGAATLLNSSPDPASSKQFVGVLQIGKLVVAIPNQTITAGTKYSVHIHARNLTNGNTTIDVKCDGEVTSAMASVVFAGNVCSILNEIIVNAIIDSGVAFPIFCNVIGQNFEVWNTGANGNIVKGALVITIDC